MRSTWDRLQRVARISVVTAVVLAPWLFGSADPWAYLFICLLVGVGVAAWLLSLVGDPRAQLRATLLTVALVVLLGFVLVQTLPLPHSFVKAVGPLSAEAQLIRAQIFGEIGAEEFLPSSLKGNSGLAAISASPAATRRSLYLLAAYVGVFLVIANTFAKWKQVRGAAGAIVISSFIMTVFGLVQKFSGTHDLYWFHTPRFGGSIFGPFTNRNHFAGYMNMAFGATLGLLLAASRATTFKPFRNWREKLAWLSTGRASRITLLSFAAVLTGATVLVTLSRGGIVSLAASLGVVGTFVAVRNAVPNRGRIIVAVVLLVVAAVVWLGWERVAEQLGTLAEVAKDPLSTDRAVAARDALRIFTTSPLFGAGFGSFQHVFPVFQSQSIQFGRWLHAHNDYVQLLAEGGVMGTSLVLLAGALFVRTVHTGFAKATAEGRLLVGGLSVGVLAIALHSFVDYSLHKPANALLLAALCGMSIAAVNLSHDRKKSKISGH